MRRGLEPSAMTTPAAAVVMVTVVVATALTAAEYPDHPEHFKLGFMAPWSSVFEDYSALTCASAISIAIERIHNDPTLNKSMRFRCVCAPASFASFQTLTLHTV